MSSGPVRLRTAHLIGELSRRYVRGGHEQRRPVWRSAPANSKQGSGGPVADQEHIAELYDDFIEYADTLYDRMLSLGVAPEQALLVLPANALYTKYLWSPSLQAALNFVSLRSADDAQSEIRWLSGG